MSLVAWFRKKGVLQLRHEAEELRRVAREHESIARLHNEAATQYRLQAMQADNSAKDIVERARDQS